MVKDASIVNDGNYLQVIDQANNNSTIAKSASDNVLWIVNSSFQVDKEIKYYSGIKLKETQNIYRWYKK